MFGLRKGRDDALDRLCRIGRMKGGKNLMPYFGSRYNAQTHHTFWDGGRHYWTGMAVSGMEDQDPTNPNCCQDLSVYEGGEVTTPRSVLRGLRTAMNLAYVEHRMNDAPPAQWINNVDANLSVEISALGFSFINN